LDTQQKPVTPGAYKNEKFVTSTPFNKKRPKLLKTPHTQAKKVCS